MPVESLEINPLSLDTNKDEPTTKVLLSCLKSLIATNTNYLEENIPHEIIADNGDITTIKLNYLLLFDLSSPKNAPTFEVVDRSTLIGKGASGKIYPVVGTITLQDNMLDVQKGKSTFQKLEIIYFL